VVPTQDHTTSHLDRVIPFRVFWDISGINATSSLF
jgi:hypothetical protein